VYVSARRVGTGGGPFAARIWVATTNLT